MVGTIHTGADFDANYLRIWAEPDADQRRVLIEQMWAPRGSLHISSSTLTITGTADIAEHINRVHNDRTAGQGLTFSYDQRTESDDTLLLRWSATVPNGDVVGCGVDTVFRDADGKVTHTHMLTDVS